MNRKIAALTAALVLGASGVAEAGTSERQARTQADTYVAGVANDLNAYTVRLRTDRFASKVRFAYYLRWRDVSGRLCKFEREPQIVVSLKTGSARFFNFNSARCQ